MKAFITVESRGCMFRKLIARISATESPPPWTVFSALSSVIAAFASVIIGTALTLITLNNSQYGPLAGWTVGAIFTIAFVLIRFRKPEEREALRLSAAKSGAGLLQEVFLMLLIGVGLAVALDVISARVAGTSPFEPELQRPFGEAARAASLLIDYPIVFISWIFAIAFMVIGQPISEELIFRGILLPSLRKATGAWPGYIVSALIFAVFHLLAYSTSISDFNSLWHGQILPFIAGLIFGAVRLYTGSTRAAILAHAGFGLFAIVKIVTLVG
jgi:membrane protease YdiL (CAAX protease family)